MPDNFGVPTRKELTFFQTKAGDRTLTSAQKRKIKEKQGFRCAICKKKFPEWQLQVHHKKEVHKHKDKLTGVNIPVFSLGKKIKPKYDRRSNLEAVCIPCHNKTKSKKSKKITKRAKSPSLLRDIKIPKIDFRI